MDGASRKRHATRSAPGTSRFQGRNPDAAVPAAPLPGRRCAKADIRKFAPDPTGTFLPFIPSKTPMACALDNRRGEMRASFACDTRPRILIADDQTDLIDA